MRKKIEDGSANLYNILLDSVTSPCHGLSSRNTCYSMFSKMFKNLEAIFNWIMNYTKLSGIPEQSAQEDKP